VKKSERVEQLKGVDKHHPHIVDYEWQKYPSKSLSGSCGFCDICDMNRHLHKKVTYYIAVFKFKSQNILCLTHYMKMKYFKCLPYSVGRCYHGMAHPQVVGVGDGFQLWRVVASNLQCLSNI
jgi:hypothetical protein